MESKNAKNQGAKGEVEIVIIPLYHGQPVSRQLHRMVVFSLLSDVIFSETLFFLCTYLFGASMKLNRQTGYRDHSPFCQ